MYTCFALILAINTSESQKIFSVASNSNVILKIFKPRTSELAAPQGSGAFFPSLPVLRDD